MRRIQIILRLKGYRVGHQQLRKDMRQWGLHALQPNAIIPYD
jgi:hypothetical protein